MNLQFKKWIQRLYRVITRSEGSALVVSLLVMLCLVLLGLALLLQSNTEYVIALNERDSTAALYDAEAALQLTKQFIRTNGTGATLTPLLVDGSANYGILHLRTVNTAISPNGLNDDCSAGSTTCESSTSVLVNREGQLWEAFRIGVDRDGSIPAGKSGWDGPRGLVYVRVEDNHDEEPAENNHLVDTDKRINAYIISQFPIMVDANGVAISTNTDITGGRSASQKSAGISTRRLFAQFGPSTVKPAIATDGDFDIQGSADVCGDCGAVHANETLTIGTNDVDTCSDATSTETAPVRNDGGSAEIGGTIAQAAEIPIPIANPFHEDYVPASNYFTTTGDTELASYIYLQCPGYDAATNPGYGKYFALVGDHDKGRVMKAYWNSTDNVWNWQVIDVLGDGTSTTLDDCGRVVDAGTVHAPDPGAGAGIADSDPPDKQFYGFTFSNSMGGPGGSCSTDKTLGTTDFNDYGKIANLPVLGFTYMLPGTGGPSPVDTSGGSTKVDHIADFIPSQVMKNNENAWGINGNDVWSPLYNAVIFVYGNLSITGGPRTLCSTADTPPCNTPLPGSIWRVTFIAFNNINAGGTPAYAPARSDLIDPDYQYVLIAGRDIDLAGTPGGGDICPANCSDAPLHQAGYAGAIYAHEQISMHGNVTINGIVESEDAANCSTFVGEPGMTVTGSVQVYYDCIHPPSKGGENVRLQSWEEVQGSSF